MAGRGEGRRRGAAALALLAAATLTGCATADPAASVTATGGLLAARGVEPVEWPRSEAARAEADARAAELLGAPLTPAAAAEAALLVHPALEATLAELGVAQADLAQASRLANPGLSFSRLSGEGESLRTAGFFADVVDWWTRPLRRRLAGAELERVKLEVAAAVLDRVAEAQRATIELQRSEAFVARLERIEAIDRAAADYAIALHRAGNLTLRERANAEAGWAETRAELGEARAEAARLREALVRALGLRGGEALTVAPLAGLPGRPDAALPELERLALEQRLDLAAARWAVDAVTRAQRLNRRTRWLPVGVELGVERERETDGVVLTGPTVELALPIFDAGGARKARLGAELARAKAQLEALERVVRSEVRSAAGDLEAALALATLVRDELVPRRRQVLEQTIREYNQMIVGTFEVLMAKQEEIEAERRELDAVAAAWTASLDLARALGSMLPVPGGER